MRTKSKGLFGHEMASRVNKANSACYIWGFLMRPGTTCHNTSVLFDLSSTWSTLNKLCQGAFLCFYAKLSGTKSFRHTHVPETLSVINSCIKPFRVVLKATKVQTISAMKRNFLFSSLFLCCASVVVPLFEAGVVKFSTWENISLIADWMESHQEKQCESLVWKRNTQQPLTRKVNLLLLPTYQYSTTYPL